MPSYPTAHVRKAAAVLAENRTDKHTPARKAARAALRRDEPTIVSILAHRIERHEPLQSRSWASVTNVMVTAREQAVVSRWEGIIARHAREDRAERKSTYAGS